MKLLRTLPIFKGRRLDVNYHLYEVAEGKQIPFEIVTSQPAVVMIPLLDSQTTILVNQFRPAMGKRVWEFPAGLLDLVHESPFQQFPDILQERYRPPVEQALLELEQECGYKAEGSEYLGEFASTPGMTNEVLHACLLWSLTKTQQALEPGEELIMKELPLAILAQWIRDGIIQDGKSLAALQLAMLRSARFRASFLPYLA